MVLLCTACKAPKAITPVHGILTVPNASTLLEYTDDSNRVMFAQVLAFHPEYTAFQLRLAEGNTRIGHSWNLELMADALADAPALLTGFEPQDTRLNRHTALCLSRKVYDSLFNPSQVRLSMEKSIKAYEANGDSLLLYVPLVQGAFKRLGQQNYLISYNGNPRAVPTTVAQERLAHVRSGFAQPSGKNPLLFGWNDFAGHNWSLARYWQYDSLPVLPELKPGSCIDYQYYRPVQLPDGKWQYRNDTFRVEFLQTDTLIRTRIWRVGRAPGYVAGEVYYDFHMKSGKGRFSAPSPFPPLGFCLQDSTLTRLFADAYAAFPSVSNKKIQTASLMLNAQGNHVWQHTCRINGVAQDLSGFRVQSEDGSMETAFIGYAKTPFLLSYREGMHRLELISVCTGRQCEKSRKR